MNYLHINGMQGVRGSNPLSSTPGHRPNPASAVPGPPASGSKSAAICLCEANLVVRHAVDSGQHRRCRRPAGRALPGPPPPARSCATKAGSAGTARSITTGQVTSSLSEIRGGLPPFGGGGESAADADRQRPLAKGVVFVKEPGRMAYGGMDAVFDDTCGNLINLHQE